MSFSKLFCIAGVALLLVVCFLQANVAEAKRDGGGGGRGGGGGGGRQRGQGGGRGRGGGGGGGGGNSGEEGGGGVNGTDPAMSGISQELMANVTSLMSSINNATLTQEMKAAQDAKNVTAGMELLQQISAGQVGGTQEDWTRASELLAQAQSAVQNGGTASSDPSSGENGRGGRGRGGGGGRGGQKRGG